MKTETSNAPESHYSVCHLEDCNNAEANARLIASAPELLRQRDELLQSLESMLENFPMMTARHWKPEYLDRVNFAKEQARQAIAKAKGRG